MTLNALLAVLREIGRNKVWKGCPGILKELQQSALIELHGHSSTRVRCSDVIDPSDQLFQQIIGQHQDNTEHSSPQSPQSPESEQLLALPLVYASDPLITQTLRKAGMASLLTFRCFERAARIVARDQDPARGHLLCDYLVHQYNAIQWSITEWQALMKVAFVPTYDVSTLVFPYGGIQWGPLRTPTKRVFVALNHRINVSKKKKTGQFGKKGLNRNGRETYQNKMELLSLLADETTEALDVSVANGGRRVGGGVGGATHNELTELLAVPYSMFASSGPKMGSGMNPASNTHTSTTTTHMRSFQASSSLSSTSRHSSLQLRLNAHLCWTRAHILPPIFDKAPAGLLKVLGISQLPSSSLVMRHLKQVAVVWHEQRRLHDYNKHNQVLTTCLQSVVFGCCAVLNHGMHRGLIHLPTVRSCLSRSAFVVMDDGTFALPGSICIDLESPLGELALAPPSYLPVSLHGVLKAAGSSSISGLDPPKVVSKGAPLVQCWDDTVRSLCLSNHLSDVALIAPGDGGRQTIVPAHKLVLALASPAFGTMFGNGGFAESMGGGGGGSAGSAGERGSGGERENHLNRTRTKVHLPEWVHVTALELMLRYVYGCGNPLQSLRPTGDTVTVACSLLRLSDFYDLKHLKSLTEVWLATNDIVDVYNVVSLLTHAYACRATQLVKYAVYCCREMHSVVCETEEWEELDEALKRRVTDVTGKKNKNIK